MQNYYLLFYEITDDYLEKRGAIRKPHLEHTLAYAEKGYLVLGGALEDPVDGAVLVFHVPDQKVIEEFAKNDPYVKGGIIKGWKIRKYKAVTGYACKNPLSPSAV